MGSYVYSIPDELARKRIDDLYSTEAPWAKTARDLDAHPIHKLEALSTVVFLREHGLSGSIVKQKFMTIKPNLKSMFDWAEGESRRFCPAVP